ncbi:MAG: hypothetical protein WD638_08610 [Nitriliruptoraceae bacterium]
MRALTRYTRAEALLVIDPPAALPVLEAAVREAAGAPPVYGEDAERLSAVAQQVEETLGRMRFAAAQAEGRPLDAPT